MRVRVGGVGGVQPLTYGYVCGGGDQLKNSMWASLKHRAADSMWLLLVGTFLINVVHVAR